MLLQELVIYLLQYAYDERDVALSNWFLSCINTTLTILLKDPISCAFVFKSIMTFVFQYATHIEVNFADGDYSYMYFKVLESILEALLLSHSGWDCLVYSPILSDLYETKSKYILDNMTNPTVGKLHGIVDPIIHNVLDAFQVAHRSSVSQRIKPFKEDLIAGACHPRRLANWFTKGYSIDEVFTAMGWDD